MNSNKQKYQFLCRDEIQARAILDTILACYSNKHFCLELGWWMQQLPYYEAIKHLIITYPGFIENYDINQLIQDQVTINHIRPEIIAQASVFIYIVYYSGGIWDMAEKVGTSFKKDNTGLYRLMKTISGELHTRQFHKMLRLCLLEVTGAIYFDKFRRYISRVPAYTYTALKKDPVLNKHLRLMIFYNRVSYFMDACQLLILQE